MYFVKTYRSYIIILIFTLLWQTWTFAQTNQVQFGKNRVQFHDDFDQWLYYETNLFTVYWYGKSRNAGHKVVRIAEREFNDIIKTIDFKTNEKTEFLVFADITDLKQSNIGISDAFEYDGDITKTVDNKVFIAFDGNHNHLRRQIREGIAAVYLNNLLFGSNLQEMVQNSLMLSLPQWFKTGLISYFGEEWSSHYDLRVAKVLSNKRIKDFEQLAAADPRLAGQMFWNYVGFNYGKNAIGNLVYVTRINRNLDKGFQYVLGNSYDNIIQSVFKYYKSRSDEHIKELKNIDRQWKPVTRMRTKEVVTAMELSPDGKSLLMVTNQISKIRVRLVDLKTGKSKTLLKYGSKNKIQAPDPNYPCIAWKNDGKNILICYERFDKINLREYDVGTGKHRSQLIPGRYQRLYRIAYWDDRNIVINGTTDGYGNIFLYKLSTRESTEITTDPFDKLDMTVAGKGSSRSIYFSSNRPDASLTRVSGDSILPVGSFNIFSLQQVTADDGTSGWSMAQHTFNDNFSERLPYVDEQGILHFLTNEYKNNAIVRVGPDEKYRAGTSNVNLINLPVVIDQFALSGKTRKIYLNIFDGERYRLTSMDADRWVASDVGLSKSPKEFDYTVPGDRQFQDSSAVINARHTVFRKVETEIPENMKFITKYGDITEEETSETVRPERANEPKVSGANKMMPLNPLNIVPYRLRFKITDSGVNFDNSMLFEGMNSYIGGGESNLFPPFGLLLKAQLRDMFEDYRLEGGVRIPVALNGNEAYLVYDDLKYRLDKRVALYRKASNERLNIGNISTQVRKNIILMGQYDVKYALDQFNAVKVGLTLRQDRSFYKDTDLNSLDKPNETDQRVGIRVTYILDNTLDKGLNLMAGTRIRVFGEWVKQFEISFDKRFNFNFNKGHMWVGGFDARNYMELGRHSILATRVAGQVSFGTERILYYLGGSDGWLFPGFNNETQTASDVNFAYQVPAPSLRGFQYNIRNGNNYGLISNELRVPFLRYLSRRPISSTFLNNLQLVGFFDVGSAWTGWNPFTKYNPLNTVYISQPGIDVKVNYFRNPIVFGYGAGIRFLLFGYFIRLDYARGWDTGNLTPPRMYISLGTDF